MANLINSAEVRETWAPIIESATGINEAEKLAWMSEYCHNHKLYEDAHIMSLGTAGNIYGMGDVSLPSASADGSGDKAPTLLPLAMQVAAQTIGLDLVPVVPMAGPMGLLSYLDFVYEGGKLADSVSPTYIKTDGAKGDINGNTSGGFTFTWVGSSRIDNMDIYKVAEAATTTGSVADAVNALDTEVDGADAVVKSVELVKALEDHIKGFAAADEDGNPFSRGVGEQTPDKVMGLSLFSKSVAAETFQVAAAVTREQVQDLKQFGVDAVAQVESVLTNELTQSINNLILSKLNALGKTNVTASGADLGLDLATGALGGETIASNHRRILTSILAAANFIANRGRRGAGNFCVVGPKVATALQSVAGFVANPMANTLSQAAGAIYPVGSVAGVNVYTDPRQEWESAAGYEVVVGRKGDGNGPGLVFMPYLMAESVQTIAEGTMAPKVAVKSRFALVEAGFHPETQYVTYLIEGLVL